MRPSFASRSGISLVEMAVVVMIIGFLATAVMVGKELIKNSGVRALGNQMQQYTEAVQTFRTKYAGLPGDLATADTFFSYTLTTVTTRNGDGNGIIADSAGAVADPGKFDSLTNVNGNELIHFWPQLSAASLVPGTYLQGLQANILGSGNNFPRTALDRGGILPINLNGRHYFHIGLSSISAGAPQFSNAALTPGEAMELDTKLDDGVANLGFIVARNGTTAAAIAAAPTTGAATCLTDAATYNVTVANNVIDTKLCQLQVRMQ